ncbi:MAG TPA: membrane protein insertase YidC [Dongiaceae bacterium]|nr:membrane protein insertase YidC [Dongiaceae bacterium]
MENKNVILAIVLSAAILIGWTFLQAHFFPAPAPKPQQTQEQQPQQQQQQAQQAAQDTGRKVVSREEALKESPRVAIDTPRLSGSIALKGARLDDLVLKGYRETADPSSPNVVLLSPRNSKDAYFANLYWTADSSETDVPTGDTLWQADGTTLSPDKPVTLTWDNGHGLAFTRKFEIDSNYMFTVTDTVANSGSQSVELAPTGRVIRYGTPANASQTYVLHEGPIGVYDGSLKEEKYKSARSQAEEPENNGKFVYPNSTGGWMGISDKYWLVSQIPPQDETLTGSIFYDPKGDFYQVDFAAAKRQVPAGGSVTRQQHLFAGAKVVNMLDEYSDRLGIPLFDRAVDFGWFFFLTKPLFKILDYIFRFVGNFGVAILCLTVLVKAVMFPLANKSYRSMSKMKILGPKMKELKEKHGEDRAKLNQEMMALYKREKVNPAAGCLPIVVQIPVFYALYKVIYTTIEMRHAPFFGWIHDLSAPDPTSVLNLFGLIPWDYHVLLAIPVIGGLLHFLSIGVWPLIMGFTMWLQMRLNPTPPDPVQARIFALMPIIFTFMLAPFSAGLVIYWAWNNTLSIAQQRLIMWRMGVKP